MTWIKYSYSFRILDSFGLLWFIGGISFGPDRERVSRVLLQIPFHRVGVFSVCIVLGLDLRDDELESVCIQVESCAVTLAHVQGHVLSVETLYHRHRCLVHQLLRQTWKNKINVSFYSLVLRPTLDKLNQ